MNKASKSFLVIAGLACALPSLGQAQGSDPRVEPGSPPPAPAPSTPPSLPDSPATSRVAPPPSMAKVSIEQRGTVSDVWDAEIRHKDKENKVVLIETDQGQVVLADLGPAETVKVKEGNPATVMGEMVSIEGSPRFVPAHVKVGAKATGPAPGSAQVKSKKLGATARPHKQMISGKVVDKEKMSAKETRIDHELAVIEVSPGTRVLVDLGPSDQLSAVEFDEGDRLNVEGQRVQVNESFIVVADTVQKGDQQVRIQHKALPKGERGTKTQGLGPVPTPIEE